jgi:hypothetical protein
MARWGQHEGLLPVSHFDKQLTFGETPCYLFPFVTSPTRPLLLSLPLLLL